MKTWVKAVIWIIVLSFVASIFVLAAQFTFQMGKKKTKNAKSTENNQKKNNDSKFSNDELAKKLVTVNGEAVTFDDFYNEYKNIDQKYRSYFQLNTLFGKLNYLKNIIDRRIIIQKASDMKISFKDKDVVDNLIKNSKKMGYMIDRKKLEEKLGEGDPDFVRWFNNQKLPMIQTEIEKRVMSGVKISEEDIEKYYSVHKNDFTKKDGSGKTIQLGLDDVRDSVVAKLNSEKIDKESLDFYNKNLDAFRGDKRIKLAQIFLSKNSDSRLEKIADQLSNDEILAYYKMNRRKFLSQKKVNPSHIFLRFSDRKNDVKTDPAEIKAYYEKHLSEYNFPEKMRAMHILLDTNNKKYASKVKVSDNEIKKYYNNNIESFKDPEKVHAQHILVNDEKKAMEIYNEIKNGANFAKMAEKYSKDPGSAKNGGDLGFFAKGEMVKPFEKAAFSAKVGELLKPVKSNYGYHIIKVVEHVDAKKESLADAKGKILKQLKQEKINDYLKKLAEDIRKQAESGTDFRALVNKYSDAKSAANGGDLGFFYKGRQPEGFNDSLVKDEILNGKNLDSDIESELFKTKAGEVSPVIKSYRGYHIFNVIEKEDPKPMPLAQVSNKIKNKIILDKAQKQTADLADKIIADLRKGKDFSSLAKKYSKADSAKNGGKLGYIPQGDLSKNILDAIIDSYWVKGKTLLSPIENKIFAMRNGGIAKVAIADGVEIIKINGIKPPEVLPFDKVKAKVKKELVSVKADKKAKRIIDQAYEELIKGGDFKELASKFSDGKTASEGGVLGYMDESGNVDQEDSKNFTGEGGKFGYNFSGGMFTFGLNIDPQFKVEALLLEPGKHSTVFETADGYHILKVIKREDGKIKPYDKVQQDIHDILKNTVSNEEVRQYYDEHKEEFRIPEKVSLKHILVQDEGSAKKVVTLLSQGEKFSDVAKKFSIDSSKKDGGNLGFVTKGKLPPSVDKVAFSLGKGETSGIIKSKYGYHIIKVEQKVASEIPSFEKKKAEIKEMILKPRREKAFKIWMTKERNLSKIKYYGGNILNLFGKI